MLRHNNSGSNRQRQQNQEGFRWLWRSELGKAYEKDIIEERDDEVKRELRWLCSQPANRACADCGTVNGKAAWASVNLGVFLCIGCASFHRSLPENVSRPKCCTMDLWGPDELERMKRVGNAQAVQMYGGPLPRLRPSTEASDQEWKVFLTEKYGEDRKFAPKKKNRKSRLLSGSINPLEPDISWCLGLICDQVGASSGRSKKENMKAASKLPCRENKPMNIELPIQKGASEYGTFCN
mmetsp:Transcript_15263/g.29079  ORF Transcript_15263/g.29079 Transcript_15263/m.29079 type:complete len:238 (-) Transcript_15263:35-748(-)|eukprot:CAMPEP_0197449562 /NCGR_PEP_ID=MMETSP1175-20131217/22065_1 /TAXON_ID=1003142 /ORGANISM="Triceratium dubium, Strain CCMP147" /LENGTH=237 /DNA_ID=CAMNT_0042981725 /DNA_START=41 /DNA_END=754 /DNA_ORIENTATION=+